MREELIKAIRCCRKSDCEHCPLQRDICDELDVLMESVPVELLNMIEDELETNLTKKITTRYNKISNKAVK